MDNDDLNANFKDNEGLLGTPQLLFETLFLRHQILSQ